MRSKAKIAAKLIKEMDDKFSQWIAKARATGLDYYELHKKDPELACALLLERGPDGHYRIMKSAPLRHERGN